MFQIILEEKIPASTKVVWEVICNTDAYPDWNTFVVACQSSFEVGSPIVMDVKVLPFMAIRQKESVRQNKQESLLEYGIQMPFGILYSSRMHILESLDANTSKYQSVFILKGILSPIVGMLLGSQLRRGFSDMTNGIVTQAVKIQALKNA